MTTVHEAGPFGSEEIGAGRLAKRGALAAVLSVIANLAILLAAESLFGVDPNFRPLMPVRVTILTVLGVSFGVFLAAMMNRFAGSPRRTFLKTIYTLLVLSFLPDLAIYFGPEPGATVPAVGALMSMHVAAGAIFIVLVARAGQKTDSTQS